MKNYRILCFGDSNTWGYIPSKTGADERYPPDIRWTGLLQKKLGSHFVIIEEGLNSRTTSLDYPDLPGKNGLTSLPEVWQKNLPIHLVILSLGTNDLKKIFNQTPLQIANGIEKLLNCVEGFSQSAKSNVLLIAPAIPKLNFVYDSYRYPELESKAKQLGPLYRKISEDRKVEFLDLSSWVESSSVDGVHFDPDQHLKIAEKLLPIIKKLSQST